jgi:hypothetical protein
MEYADLSEAERSRLRAAYEAGFSAGNCRPWLLGDDPDLIALIDAVMDDWFQSLETMQATARARYPFPGVEALPIPEWLRAETERQAALGDAQPPTFESAPLRRSA